MRERERNETLYCLVPNVSAMDPHLSCLLQYGVIPFVGLVHLLCQYEWTWERVEAYRLINMGLYIIAFHRVFIHVTMLYVSLLLICINLLAVRTDVV